MWRVKQYPDGKFALWSTISDGYIVRKCKRETMIAAISCYWLDEVKVKIAELRKTFPDGWTDKDTVARIHIEQKEVSDGRKQNNKHETSSGSKETDLSCGDASDD